MYHIQLNIMKVKENRFFLSLLLIITIKTSLFVQKADTVIVDELCKKGRLIKGLKDGEFSYINKDGITRWVV